MFNILFFFSFKEDVNECNQVPSVCGIDEMCRNYPGTYQCFCTSPGKFLYEGNCIGKLKKTKHLMKRKVDWLALCLSMGAIVRELFTKIE